MNQGSNENIRDLSSSSTKDSSKQLLPEWKKICYESQPYPDNYIDENLFLDQLKCKLKYLVHSFSV